MVLKAKRAPAGAPVREAGELLALEELDQTGVAITSEGALVRVLEVMPRNPLIMADAESLEANPHRAVRLAPPGFGGAESVRLSRDSWVAEVLNPELGGSP